MQGIKLNDICVVNPRISSVLRKDKLKLLRTVITNRHKSLRKFSKLINCCDTSLGDFLKGESNPTLALVMKMSSLLETEPEQIIQKLIAKNEPDGSFIQIDEFPLKPNSVIASLVGHAFGDGHLNEWGFQFTNNSQELLDDVISKVKQLPIKNLEFRKAFHKVANLRFFCLVKDILASFGAPIGNKVKVNWLSQNGLKMVI